MRILAGLLTICLAGIVWADTLRLRDGRTVEGIYLGGDSRQIRLAVGDKVENYAVGDVASLVFGGAAPTTATNSPAPPPEATRSVPFTPSPAAPQRTATAMQASKMEVASGTPIVIRMIDDIDSERDAMGQTFRASVDESVTVNGNTVIPRGADVVVKLVEDKQSGRLTGRTELTLDLVSITVNGKEMEVATTDVTQASESRTGQTAKRAGGLAAAGAVIGAIVGGGKGAAVGATTGAGIGAGVQVATKGATVKIPSETRLTFTLEKPLTL